MPNYNTGYHIKHEYDLKGPLSRQPHCSVLKKLLSSALSHIIVSLPWNKSSYNVPSPHKITYPPSVILCSGHTDYVPLTETAFLWNSSSIIVQCFRYN